MNSPAFTKALRATAYLRSNGDPAPGLIRAGADVTSRLRPVLSDSRVGLQADAVYSAQSVPTSIFKDAGHGLPTSQQIARWHEAAWNVGLAPLLWIITPTDIRLYDCYASPPRENPQQIVAEPLAIYALDADEHLRALDSMCGRFATETGSFWSSEIGKKIDRRHRVDRELLREINALEERLTLIPVAGEHSRSSAAETTKIARDFAQRLIGRCIFTSYLIDRGIAQPFLPDAFPTDVAQMFADVESTFRLFQWLRSTFNGDLFPMDDPGAEHKHLQEAHLKLLRDFAESRSLVSGQGRLFRFRYDAIPVDLISSIYQQFARSSAAENAHVQGLHYTPVELIHLTLDPVLEGLPASARVIDPTCGSGAFLVEAFRRIVWKHSQGQPISRSTVRRVLYKQLYGIDINKSALGIAAFSLYLAALELDEEPVEHVADLKFDRLIGKTLFEADTVHDQLPRAITERPFDAVIGNPPWTFVRKSTRQARSSDKSEPPRPRRSPDQEFLWKAVELAGDGGRIGMVMKASPFFSKDLHAIEARNALFNRLSPAALVNLSALRKEQLFPDATGPALLFFARCALMEQNDRILVGSIPWTPDFRRNGIFQVGPGELRSMPLQRVLRTPAMLKASTFGTVRDGWLIEKLERSLPTFEEFLSVAGLNARGQGIQVRGGDINEPPAEFYNLRLLTPEQYTPLRVDRRGLPPFEYQSLHRVRNAVIFRGPLLICPEGSFLNTTGRYSATVSRGDLLYTESFYGISFAKGKTDLALVLNGILNSSLTTFQLAFGGSAWGLERTKVKPVDLLALRVPGDISMDEEVVRALVDAEQKLSEDPFNPEALSSLDRAVYELYGLERDEAVVASEAVIRARALQFESRDQRMEFVKAPSATTLGAYAAEVVRTVNAYLRARGKRHLEAVIYGRRFRKVKPGENSSGLTAVKFRMADGAPTNGPIVRHGDDADTDRLAALFHGQESADEPPYLNERRVVRVYRENELFVLKPSEARYWTRTAGLNDADVILADHWIRDRHAPAA